MAEHIITPKPSWLEKLKNEIKSFSPQVKQGLIAAAVALIIAISGWAIVYSENSRLRAKVHDLELEVLPFRNLAVQEFNRADAASLKRLADSMATLHKDYSAQLETINGLRTRIEQLRKDNEQADRNLFSRMTHETISTADTNRFIKRHTTAGGWRVCMVLAAAPIPGTVQGSINTSLHLDDPTFNGPHSFVRNVLVQTFWGQWGDFEKFEMAFHLKYLPDTRETNLIKRVEFANDDVILFDGKALKIR